jgi:hypothetical protein
MSAVDHLLVMVAAPQGGSALAAMVWQGQGSGSEEGCAVRA